ncbi:MAG: hypothetical protein PVF85_05725 [Anaerolineales bacterium]|jgi:hypothetical protein
MSEVKKSYDLSDDAQFRVWLQSYMEAYNTRLAEIDKELSGVNSKLSLMIVFFIILPIGFILLSFCTGGLLF